MKYSTTKGRAIANAKKMGTEEFINRAKVEHGEKYDYSKVDYINAHTKVTIICPIHGEWKQKPMVHLRDKCGCPICGNIRKGIRKKENSYDKFIISANKKHNNKYTYIKESYTGITNKMQIICPTHGLFLQTPDVHKRGGCQRCGCTSISSISQQWLNSLNVPHENREVWIHFSNKRIKVDAYDAATNTVFEFWGDYWHGNPAVYNLENTNMNNKIKFSDLYQSTLDRIQLIESAGYNLVQIWENDWLSISKDNSSSS